MPKKRLTPEDIRDLLNSPIPTLGKKIIVLNILKATMEQLFQKLSQEKNFDNFLTNLLKKSKKNAYLGYNKKSIQSFAQNLQKKDPEVLKILQEIEILKNEINKIFDDFIKPIINSLSDNLLELDNLQANVKAADGWAIAELVNDENIIRYVGDFTVPNVESAFQSISPSISFKNLASMTKDVQESIKDYDIKDCCKMINVLNSSISSLETELSKFQENLAEQEELTLKDVVDYLAVIADSKEEKKLVVFAKKVLDKGDSKAQEKFMNMVLDRLETMEYGGRDVLLEKINQHKTAIKSKSSGIMDKMKELKKHLNNAQSKSDKILELQQKLDSPKVNPSNEMPPQRFTP
ncbi:MAG: hypothetical protein HRT87_01650 [Legionellales bacterium]|nr:hypothetical protein [Legionellales bacterium]